MTRGGGEAGRVCVYMKAFCSFVCSKNGAFYFHAGAMSMISAFYSRSKVERGGKAPGRDKHSDGKKQDERRYLSCVQQIEHIYDGEVMIQVSRVVLGLGFQTHRILLLTQAWQPRLLG